MEWEWRLSKEMEGRGWAEGRRASVLLASALMYGGQKVPYSRGHAGDAAQLSSGRTCSNGPRTCSKPHLIDCTTAHSHTAPLLFHDHLAPAVLAHSHRISRLPSHPHSAHLYASHVARLHVPRTSPPLSTVAVMRQYVSAVAARLPSSLRVPSQRNSCLTCPAAVAPRSTSTARSSASSSVFLSRSSFSSVSFSSSSLRRSFSSAPAASVESRVSSDGSHSDFSARSKPSAGGAGSGDSSSDASGVISSDVSSHDVFLYMKGNPASPKCGFSANVVRILQHLRAPFSSRDVLEDPAVREAVKAYSDWPTLPQLYVKGEFVGGSDIITQLFKSGELEKMLTQAGIIQQSAAAATSASSSNTGTATTAAAGGADSKLAQ